VSNGSLYEKLEIGESVSSTGQNGVAQVELLTRNGAERILVDKANGTNRTNRPKLAEALTFVREGDTLGA